MTIDHFIPLAKGGSNHIRNLRLAHKKCNLEKGNRIETRNRPFKDIFDKMETQRKNKIIRCKIWGIFPAEFHTKTGEMVGVDSWIYGPNDFFFNVVTYICMFFIDVFTEEEPSFVCKMNQEDIAKLDKYDRMRLERSDFEDYHN